MSAIWLSPIVIDRAARHEIPEFVTPEDRARMKHNEAARRRYWADPERYREKNRQAHKKRMQRPERELARMRELRNQKRHAR